jgi:hypothetical protein
MIRQQSMEKDKSLQLSAMGTGSIDASRAYEWIRQCVLSSILPYDFHVPSIFVCDPNLGALPYANLYKA